MDLIIIILYGLGIFFNFTGVLGIVRMPDIYCRLHSSSKNTTLGALLVIVGLALQMLRAGEPPAALKILLIGVFIMVVTPIGSHALARASYKSGVPLWDGSVVDHYADASESYN